MRTRVLDAFVDVVATRGLASASVDEIASRANVSKTTLYTRWPDRSALIVEGFRHVASQVPDVPADAGFGEILEDILTRTADEDVQERRSRLLNELRAAAGGDPAVAAVLDERHQRWRLVIEDMIERGKRSGDVPVDRDVTVAAEVVMAVVTERQLQGRPAGRPLRDLVWRLLTEDRPY